MTQEMVRIFQERKELNEISDSNQKEILKIIDKESKLLRSWSENEKYTRDYSISLNPDDPTGWTLYSKMMYDFQEESQDIQWGLRYSSSPHRSFPGMNVSEIATWVLSERKSLLKPQEHGPQPDWEEAELLLREKTSRAQKQEALSFSLGTGSWKKFRDQKTKESLEVASGLKEKLPEFKCRFSEEDSMGYHSEIVMTHDFSLVLYFSVLGPPGSSEYIMRVKESFAPRPNLKSWPLETSIQTLIEDIPELWLQAMTTEAVDRYAVQDGDQLTQL